MSSFILSGQKLFMPSRHVWLRAMKVSSSSMSMPSKVLPVSSSSDGAGDWRVDVGMTFRGIEDIGDVQKYEFETDIVQAANSSLALLPRRILSAGKDTVLTIHWDAHHITAADELYHTVWETISEQTLVTCPVNGWVEDINASLLSTKHKAAPVSSMYIAPDLEEDTVLFTIRTNYESIQPQFKNLCSKDEYEEIVESSSERGRFYDGNSSPAASPKIVL